MIHSPHPGYFVSLMRNTKLVAESSAMDKPSLHGAILEEDITTVEELLSDKSVDIDEPYWTGDGKTPLLLAASNGNVDIVRILCEHGCNTKARTLHGETALHLAISSRKNVTEQIQVLLSHGCDPNIQENIKGHTPLHHFAKYICSSEDFSESNLEALKLIIEHCDASIPDYSGRTPLHRSVVSNIPIEFVEVLLCCDAKRQNIRGETSLHEGLEADCRTEIIQVLVDHSDLSATNVYNETPLHVASRKGKNGAVKLLLERGSPANAQDLKGNTALHLCAERGYVEIVENIIRYPDVDLNLQNDEGLTPLHVAVESGFLLVVQLLLGAEGCDIAVKTKRQQTALDLAQEDYRRKSQPELTSLIEEEIEKRRIKNV